MDGAPPQPPVTHSLWASDVPFNGCDGAHRPTPTPKILGQLCQIYVTRATAAVTKAAHTHTVHQAAAFQYNWNSPPDSSLLQSIAAEAARALADNLPSALYTAAHCCIALLLLLPPSLLLLLLLQQLQNTARAKQVTCSATPLNHTLKPLHNRLLICHLHKLLQRRPEP
jgi:hypothetical protein